MTEAAVNVREDAPAKINLCLHVCGRRADGFHLLDSWVVFAGVGDRLTATRADTIDLKIEGPFAAVLSAGGDNLVQRAARFLSARWARSAGVALQLEKNMPVASGIGGGSADAAATLRACAALWNVAELPPPAEIAQVLGADVPVCIAGRPTRMRGIGEQLQPLPSLPAFALVLANPGRPLATASVFKALGNRHSGPTPDGPPSFHDARELCAWLAQRTNDLAVPAREILPVIDDVITALASSENCLLARLSGSGPTCFGVYPDAVSARRAASQIRAARPDWWVAETLART